MPRLSIITPSFNQAAFIERTLRSVAGQTGASFEHLVVDGGSTDGTLDILEGFGHGLRFVSEPDAGQADAVNKGIAATHGELIGWLNSDDVYVPGALATVTAFFDANPEVDLVYGRADHIDANDRIIEPYPTEPFDAPRLREVCFICQPALFFRRRVVARYGPLDASLRYSMDYEYWLRLSLAGARFAYLPDKLAGSRLHPATKTLGSRREVHREINDMLRRHLGRTPEKWLCNYAHAALAGRDGVADGSVLGRLRLRLGYALAALRWNRWISMEMWRLICERPKVR